VIEAGGSETVVGGADAVGAKLSGGTLIVSAVGVISGGLTIEAGKAVISGTVGAFQAVKFTGSDGTLELDNLAGFHAKISGLTTSTQKIDLGGLAFSSAEKASWTQSGTSGTLTVHDGGTTATLVLIGAYATSDFKLSDDGHGGTFVKDPHPAPTARLVEAMAGLPGGRAGVDSTVVHAGGSALATVPLPIAIASGR
jgi:hypothetical protein